MPKQPPWNAVRNGLLACLSLAVGLGLCEVALRWLHPRYEHIAAPPERIYNKAYAYRHPETGVHHNVRHNSFGSRQHRDFAERDLSEASNVAFFGDSYTENVLLPVHYVFTEVLDFLLNGGEAAPLPPDVPTPARFNVLNFGMQGTGPGSQYMVYRSLSFQRHLRHVFYVHNSNDIDDLRDIDQWALGGNGEFVARLAVESSPWTRALSGLHLTYLVLDVWRRLGLDRFLPASSASTRAQSDTLVLFENLLRRWRREVEAVGGAFHVVLLPEPFGGKWFREVESLAAWPVVNLNECFERAFPNDAWADWRFTEDPHWSEAGNMVAAHCLYRYLEGELALPTRSDADLALLRSTYYRAFEHSAVTGSRWMPAAPWAVPTALAASEARRIVQRYHALAGDAASDRQGVARVVRAADAVLRSATGWNVYLDRQRRLVVFNKENCPGSGAEDNPAARLFLHLHPWNPWDVPADDRRAGFVARKPTPFSAEGSERAGRKGPAAPQECILAADLPSFPLRSARAGQLRPPAGDSSEEAVWEGEFPIDGVEVWRSAVARQQREYQLVVSTPPVARAAWNIHRVPARREVVLVKEPCVLNDTLAEYFLRFRPAPTGQRVDAAQWVSAPPIMHREPALGGFRRRASATMFDGKCVLTVPLPPWEVGAVWAGARVPGAAPGAGKVLWEAKFQWEADRFRQAWRAVRALPPAASAAFDLHLRSDTLTYVRESCEPADVRSRFFLHVFPAGEGAAARFRNFDFDFGEYVALFDGKCVAVAQLPNHGVTRVRTGQFLPDAGELWAVDLAIE